MELIIQACSDNLPRLLGLLSPSFKVRVRVGIDLKTVVCEQLGVHDNYFEDRIQTIFLNSKPVDDVTTAVINDGAILALSAAMPGLVGATFRKGGQYSWMRTNISYEKEKADNAEALGFVTLKLFNLVLKELGPDFLERGVWVDGRQVKDFFEAQSENFFQGVRTLTLDGAPISLEALSATDLMQTSVFTKAVTNL